MIHAFDGRLNADSKSTITLSNRLVPASAAMLTILYICTLVLSRVAVFELQF